MLIQCIVITRFLYTLRHTLYHGILNLNSKSGKRLGCVSVIYRAFVMVVMVIVIEE